MIYHCNQRPLDRAVTKDLVDIVAVPALNPGKRFLPTIRSVNTNGLFSHHCNLVTIILSYSLAN